MVNQHAYYNIEGECVIGNNVSVNYTDGFYPSSFYEGLAVYPRLKDSYYSKENMVDEFFNSSNWYYKYIDKNGNNVFGVKFDSAGVFSEGLAVAEVDGKTGCIDKSGNFVFYHDGINGREFAEGYIAFCVEEDEKFKYGFLDTSGNEVIPATYYSYYNGVSNDGFNNGLALVADNPECTEWSYINKYNEKVFTFSVDNPDKVRFSYR